MADPQVPASKSKPVLIMAAVLAGLQVLAGGAALADFIGPTAFGLFVLVLAAVQVGWGVFVTGQVTPWVDVVAKALPSGSVVAGPAARVDTGTRVEVVDVATGQVAAPPPADPDAGAGRNEFGAVPTRTLALVALIVAVVVLLIILVPAL